jgi:Tol biopolymer transport system component
LPASFATDPERLQRFEREAKLLASLSHPNIAGIFGIEDVDGHRYLILEFVEGETLQQKLDRGPLSIDESLEIGKQIAAALEAAHEGGIVHRDLKPGNVIITPAGDAKVLDFGLAKSGTGSPSASDVDISHSPTLTHQVTGAGVILGTAAYMSPEQARGRAVDKRTDIWSFGCVLYECLTGRQIFAGDTVSDLIARILEREPDWEALPSRTPSRIRSLLRRCLEKDVKRRLRDIGDARIEIDDVINVGASSPSAAQAASKRASSRSLIVTLGAVIVTAAVTWWLTAVSHRVPDAPAVRFSVTATPNTHFTIDGAQNAISPDGTMLAFIATDSTGRNGLWVRPMESLVARELPGTRGAHQPFWSPDGKMIGYFDGSEKLMKVPAADGRPEAIGDIKNARGGSWNQDGVIIFAPLSEGAIHRISVNGGESTPITELDSTETAHRYPVFLPDGKRFLFSCLPPHEGQFVIRMGSLDSKETRVVMETAGTGVQYAEPGYLIYQRDDVLVAHPFDAKSGRVTGEPVSLGDRPMGTNFAGAAPLSVSRNGVMAYLTNTPFTTRLVWTRADGTIIKPVPMQPGPYTVVHISPDDARALLVSNSGLTYSDIWVVDLERGVTSRVSYERGQADNPIWSPDGERVAYQYSTYGSPPRMVVVSMGAGASTRSYLEDDLVFKFLSGWTPDGKSLIYTRQDPATRRDIWVLPLDEGEPKPFLVTPYWEQGGAVSPDGRWLAYESDESGRQEVYVQAFPDGGAKYQVTTRGGMSWGWSDDGKLLFVNFADPSQVYAAAVLPGANFRLEPARVAYRPLDKEWYTDLASDGRLLSLISDGERPHPTITVVQHWPALLKRHER